jgi:hypothetical protein
MRWSNLYRLPEGFSVWFLEMQPIYSALNFMLQYHAMRITWRWIHGVFWTPDIFFVTVLMVVDCSANKGIWNSLGDPLRDARVLSSKLTQEMVCDFMCILRWTLSSVWGTSDILDLSADGSIPFFRWLVVVVVVLVIRTGLLLVILILVARFWVEFWTLWTSVC